MAKRKESDKLWWDFRYNWMFISGVWSFTILFAIFGTWVNNRHYFPLGPFETGPAEFVDQPLWAQLAATILALTLALCYLTVIYNFYIGKWSEFTDPSRKESWGFRLTMLTLATLLVWLPYEDYFMRWMFTFVFVVIVWTVTSEPKSAFSAVVISSSISAAILFLRYHDSNGEFFMTVVMALAFGYFTTGYVINRGVINELLRERALVRDQAITEERFRLARDLHDTVGHSMTQITLKAQLARKLLSTDTGRASDELTDIEQLSRSLSSDIRQSIAGDVAPTLTTELARATELLSAKEIVLQWDIRVTDIPEEIDTVFGWAVREGVLNVAKHSTATRCEVTLVQDADVYLLTIRDNGTISAASASSGQGLLGLRQRAEEHGGSVHWQQTGSGFVLEVRIPAG
ncbi:MAG: sensor histidine kinase [Thermomicrobiales bacterium]|nr:sensor histidine kinase [Thermomicrobiales bacterium]